jgi:MarR family transcriptional regulator, transcriptional regulator for hemolysin
MPFMQRHPAKVSERSANMSERNASAEAIASPETGIALAGAKKARKKARKATESGIAVQEQFGLAIGNVSRAWRAKLDLRLRPLGLSQSKWLAMLYVSRAPDGLKQSELAGMLGIEAPALTRLVKQLDEAGWVKRSALVSDARCKMVRLTPKAKTVISRIDAEILQLRTESLFQLSEQEAATGLAVLRKLQTFLEVL